MAIVKQGVFSWEDVLAQRYHNNKPPFKQPRQLPPSLPHHPPAPQPECNLLSKLSPELRLLIWELVIGNSRIHIIQRSDRRMGHVICPCAPADQPTLHDDGKKLSSPVIETRKAQTSCEICKGGLPLSTKPKNGNIPALALACRLVYSESIPLLYKLPTFEFSSTWSLPYLAPTIPASIWDTAIHHVELRWAFPGHWLPCKDPVKRVYFTAGRAQWLDTCAALTRMKALRSFTLRLAGNWFCDEPVEKIAVFLEPLGKVRLRGGRRWVLVLPRMPCYIEGRRCIEGVLRGWGVDCLVVV